MSKNIFSIILICFFIISCANDEKININKNEKTVVFKDTISDISENNQLENAEQILLNEASELNSVFPDQLKVDGQQRYFLNDTLFTGISRQYDGDQILFEIKFKKGRKDGISKFWHKNGSLKSMLTFKNGIAKGAYKLWDKSGNLIEQGTN